MENPTIYNISATAGTFGVRCSNPTASNLSVVVDLIFNKMEQEVWKAVAGFEGLYEVSSLGNVKSIPHMATNCLGSFMTKERILKGSLSRGYPHVFLSKGGAKKSVIIHQLMAIAFMNHVPSGHIMVIDHINGIMIDNRVENLRIVTSRFNNSEGYRKDRVSLSSKYSGVYWNKECKKWHSQIVINGRKKYLGQFKDEIDASNAYKNELLKL